MINRITKNNLIRLDELIRLHYGGEINIYVMHGLLVSYLCSASTYEFRDLLFYEDTHEPVFKMNEIKNGDNAENLRNELLHLFFQKLYNSTIDICNKAQYLLPLVSTDGFNTKFNLENLTIEQKHNLLDWYMGFFQGFMYVWDHDKIDAYINPYSSPTQEQDDASNRFVTSLNVQYIAAFRLIKELKPKYNNKDFKYTISQIRKTVKDFDEMEYFTANFIVTNNNQYLKLITILIETVGDAKNYAKKQEIISTKTLH